MITAPVLSSTDSSNAHNAASDVLMASADDAIASTTSETAPPRRALSWRPRENATQLANMQADLVPTPPSSSHHHHDPCLHHGDASESVLLLHYANQPRDVTFVQPNDTFVTP